MRREVETKKKKKRAAKKRNDWALRNDGKKDTEGMVTVHFGQR